MRGRLTPPLLPSRAVKKSIVFAVALLGISLMVGIVLRARTSAPANAPLLRDVGPRYISNQTSQPLALHGAHFVEGMRLELGAPFGREVPVTVWDATLAYARLPADLALPPSAAEAQVPLRIAGTTGAPVQLTVINDAAFFDPTQIVAGRSTARVFVASSPTDEVLAVDVVSGDVQRLRAGDGPSALALWRQRNGEWLVVAHRFAAQLSLYDAADLRAPPRRIAAPVNAEGLLVHEGIAYVAEHARDTVVAIELETGKERWRAQVSPNPRALAMTGPGLAVGSLLAGELQVVDVGTGKVRSRIAPGPQTRIVGGGTAEHAGYIMGGKAPRELVWSARLQRLFVASIGPNIGPNPDRMEVSMNGGVGVVDPATGAFVRHLGFGAGVTDALALDEARGLLYAADEALGIVRVLDAARLVKSDEDAAAALIAEIPMALPEGFPTVRPAGDFGHGGRATVSLHAGPTALALAADGSKLHVLNRFIGQVTTLRTDGEWLPFSQVKLGDALAQRTRRLGQILYHADLGRTAMSCDACHLDGHAEGVFFEKTHPMRIYRSTTVRGARVTPPYFTPASTRSLAETASEVGGRNRYHNPAPTAAEIEALALYSAGIALLPNPFVGADGAPAEVLELPDGHTGRPRAGRAIFDAHCRSCHPAPHYAMDQDAATRGQFLDVGTPHALPLRVDQQELTFTKFAAPALAGSWDVFPMLGTGSAGFEVSADGTLVVSTRFVLREVLERHGGPAHGNSAALSAEQRNDLLAWLLSL